MNYSYYKIYNFIDYRNVIFLVSVFFVFIFFIVIVIRGFNLGLDFIGGMFIEIVTNTEIDDKKIIQDAFLNAGFNKVVIQDCNMSRSLIIKFPLICTNKLIHEHMRASVISILNKHIISGFIIKQISWIGPVVSNKFIMNGLIALISAIVSVAIYIMFRFEWRFAIGSVISLMYDTIIIVGMVSLYAIEINSTAIVALMSVLGYSLNDKIVIFDRIRENFSRMSNLSVVKIFNISLSQVLHRTIITSVTTELVLLVLLIFGGSVLHGFAVILLIGVIVGTISSIYIASALALEFGIKHEHFLNK